MKKLLSVLVASVVMCGALFAGCADTGSDSVEGGNTGSDFTVGAIYINSQNDTAGYTYAHHKGITTAMENLGLSVADNLKIIDNVPEDRAVTSSSE